MTIPFGFRFNVGGAVIGLAILAVFCVGLGALSYSLALACKNQDWMFWVVQQTLLFPLLLLAGMLLPIDDGPQWLQAMSKANPLSYIVDAQRALYAGDFAAETLVTGVHRGGLSVAALGLFVGTRAMRSSS